MRGLLVLVMVWVSCGTRSGLPKDSVDAKPEAAPMGDAGAVDADAGGGSPLEDAIGTQADVGHQPDMPAVADAGSNCSPLPVTWLPEPVVAVCPPTSAPAVCAGDDVGVVVARSAACANAWGAVLYQCIMWSAPAANEEIVVLRMNNCTDSLDTATASACGDHIEVSYIGHGTCAACDGKRSDLRAFTLPLDTRPVIATGQIIEPPCLPPDLATGGTTGSGGAIGTGGMGGTAAGGTGGTTAKDASADGGQDSPGADDSAAEASGSAGGTCGLPTAASSGMACDGESRPVGDPSGAVVETDCFSGVPNPTASLPTQGLEQVQCVLQQAPVGPAAARPARLGYRGMVVRFQGSTRLIEVYKGAIIVHDGGNVSYQVDTGRALEQYLWCFVGVDVQD